MSIQIILIFIKKIEEEIDISLREDKKTTFQKKDEMFLLIPYLVFLLQKNLLRKMMGNKMFFWKI
jgi:hypothetical protein